MDVKHWHKQHEILRATQAQKQPPLKVRDVMKVLDYNSTSSAEYALTKMLELGLVIWIENGEKKGEWYLV